MQRTVRAGFIQCRGDCLGLSESTCAEVYFPIASPITKWRVNGRRGRRNCRAKSRRTLQVAELLRKTIEFQVPAAATELREFCMGNGAKALALCAARPHIVAVR
jgi:hypothetical protein